MRTDEELYADDILGAGPHPAPVILVGLLDSLRRHWLLALLPVIVLTALGVVYGTNRKPTYTATTKLWVSGFNLSDPSALGVYTDATANLAATYARLASSQRVVAAAARRLHVSQGEVAGAVSATPVPSSPIFNVSAATAIPRRSIAIANATSKVLVGFVTNSLTQNQAASASYTVLQRAESQLSIDQAARDRAQRAYNNNPTAGTQAALVAARSRYGTMLARAQALQTIYQNRQAQSSVPNGTASILSQATSASSDRSSVLEKAIFAGLAAGIILGLALALLRANVLGHAWLRSRFEFTAA